MAVSINILNKVIDETNQEYRAALALKEMLENSFDKGTIGSIGIAYGLTLYGQEVRDVDLLLFGRLENYTLNKYYTNNPAYPKKDLKVRDFCIAIELKEHPVNRVCIHNTHVHVEYQGSWKDATEQNEKQRYACASYLETAMGYYVYTTNFVWLKSLTRKQLDLMSNENGIGALPAEFNFRDIVDILIKQGTKPFYDNDDKCYCIASNNNGYFDDIKKHIFTSKFPITGLTRGRLELLMQKKVGQHIVQNRIGEELTVLRGRAGTGKTFYLIQSALNLANSDTGKRCVILTYNHALVSDIRRLLHFMEIPDGIDNYTIQIQTLHSFFIKLMKTLGVSTNKITRTGFDDSEYKASLKELREYVIELLESKDIKTLKEENELAIDWDYVLVDEAQDWEDAEKEILFKIYGREHIIVADGVDQFMRGNKYLRWANGKQATNKIELKQGLRQKNNLVNFVNTFASKVGVKWNVKNPTTEQWAGGRILVMNNYYSTTHKELLSECKKAGGDCYDMLFLVPYQMAPNSTSKKITPIDIDLWKSEGIKLFDGTKLGREQYSTDIEECRLYQYDSCRGLEGWATICFKLDVLIENKFKIAKGLEFEEDLVLRSKEDQIKEYVYQWALMPLTRAIDTLVITLHDSNSDVGKILKEMAMDDFKDIIEWQCN